MARKTICGGDHRHELLRQGLVCRFMGCEWRLLAGEVIEDALRDCWRDGGDAGDGEDAFINWVLEADRLAGFLPTALGMDSATDEFWDRLRGAADELLGRRRHETTVQTPGRPDGCPACQLRRDSPCRTMYGTFSRSTAPGNESRR